jgi:hypothetical protein
MYGEVVNNSSDPCFGFSCYVQESDFLSILKCQLSSLELQTSLTFLNVLLLESYFEGDLKCMGSRIDRHYTAVIGIREMQ